MDADIRAEILACIGLAMGSALGLLAERVFRVAVVTARQDWFARLSRSGTLAAKLRAHRLRILSISRGRRQYSCSLIRGREDDGCVDRRVMPLLTRATRSDGGRRRFHDTASVGCVSTARAGISWVWGFGRRRGQGRPMMMGGRGFSGPGGPCQRDWRAKVSGAPCVDYLGRMGGIFRQDRAQRRIWPNEMVAS